MAIAVGHIYWQKLPLVLNAVDFLDWSWQLDMLSKAKQGIWFGRDVVFTYGPLSQWLWAHVTPWDPFSLGATLRALPLLSNLGSIALLYGVGILLLRDEPAWKRVFFLLLLYLFWCGGYFFWYAGDVKSLWNLWAFLVFSRITLAPSVSSRAVAARATAAANFLLISFLLSADVGLYSTLAFAIAVSFAALRSAGSTALALSKLFGFSAIVFLLGMLSLNAIFFGRILDFHFWIASWQIASQYRWFEALPLASASKQVFILGASGFLAVFVWALLSGRGRLMANRGALSLPAAALFSILCLETAVVRSDLGHVFLGLLPGLILAMGLLLIERQPNGWQGIIAVLILLVVTALFRSPLWQLPSWAVTPTSSTGNAIVGPVGKGCPPPTRYFQQTCLTTADYDKLSAVSTFLRANSSTSDPVVIFPYENIYGFAANRSVAGGVLQNYVIGGQYLVERQLQGLERTQPKIAIYSADWDRGDSVPNLTRTPEFWLYLQQNYSKQADVALGILGLKRDPARAAHWRLDAIALPNTRHYQILSLGSRSWKTALPSAQMAAGDFLRIRLKVSYPFTWRMLKPFAAQIHVGFADGTEKSVPAILEPNRTAVLWIYPWDEKQLLNYFSSDPIHWRSGELRPDVVSLEVEFRRMDALSVPPKALDILGVDAIQLSLIQ